MSYEVEQAFYDLLCGDAALVALISTRIYPQVAPQNVPDDEMPSHVVYQVVSSIPERHLKGPGAPTVTRMQVDCYARVYSDAKAIARAIRECADGYRGTITSPLGDGTLELRSVKLEDARDGYEYTTPESGWHRVSLDYMVWHPSTVPLHVGS